MYTPLFHLVPVDFFIFMCWFFEVLKRGAYIIGCGLFLLIYSGLMIAFLQKTSAKSHRPLWMFLLTAALGHNGGDGFACCVAAGQFGQLL